MRPAGQVKRLYRVQFSDFVKFSDEIQCFFTNIIFVSMITYKYLSVPVSGKLDHKWEGGWSVTSVKNPVTVAISDGKNI